MGKKHPKREFGHCLDKRGLVRGRRNDEGLKALTMKAIKILTSYMEQDLSLEITLETTNTSSAVTINTDFNDNLFSICIFFKFYTLKCNEGIRKHLLENAATSENSTSPQPSQLHAVRLI